MNQNPPPAQAGPTCPKCNQPGLMTEAVGDGKVRRSCTACGFNEVKDQAGRQLLTDDVGQGSERTEQVNPNPSGPQYLVEG